MTMRDTTTRRRTSRLRWTGADSSLLLIVLLIALGIRATSIDPAPSYDELWHLALSTGSGSPVGRYANDHVYVDLPRATALDHAPPAWQVWAGMDGVLHPPLYVLTLRLWRDVFGEGDAAAHAYSLAWSLVAIGFTFAAARVAMDRAAALLVGVLFAIAPVQVYFAQEIRGYAMLTGLASIAVWIVTRIEVAGPTRRRAIALAAMTLPMLLTHYFATGAAIAIAVYSVVRLRGACRRAFLATIVFAAIAYAIVWLPFAVRQLASLGTGDEFAHVDSLKLGDELWWLVAAPARLMIEGVWIVSARSAWPALAVGGACLVLPWFFARRLPSLLPWTMLLAGTVLSIGVLDAARSTWLGQMIRYLATASPVVPLLIVGVPWAARRPAGYLAGVVATIALAVIPRGDRAVIADSPSFAGMAAWASANVPPGDAVLIYGGDARGYRLMDAVLLTLAHEPALFPRTTLKLTRPTTPAMRNALSSVGWIFFPGVGSVPTSPALAGTTLRSAVFVPGEGVIASFDLHDAPSTRPTTSPLEASQ